MPVPVRVAPTAPPFECGTLPRRAVLICLHSYRNVIYYNISKEVVIVVKPSQVRATNNYIKNHTRRFTLQCNRETDADIIEFLESVPNYTELLKDLIRREISSKK